MEITLLITQGHVSLDIEFSIEDGRGKENPPLPPHPTPALQPLACVLVSSFIRHPAFLEGRVFSAVIALTESRSQIKYL